LSQSDASKTLKDRPLAFLFWLLALVLALYVVIDGFFIEPNWIEVTHSVIQAPVTVPLKIAHLTDIHTNVMGHRERHLIEILNQEKPDIVLITGDSINRGRGSYEAVHQLYEQLRAPLGVWFVHGNWEDWHPVRHEQAFYSSAGIHLLVNANARPRADFWLIGLDDPTTGHPDFAAATKGIPAGAFTIALFHSPAAFHRVAGRASLALAGHTHGGQVRIPFVPPFWLPVGSGGYVAGWYEENGSRLYISRGLGMTYVPVRFLCRPELVFITLTPEAGGN
jgi:predicted MPP superfamily phosphohydrolase